MVSFSRICGLMGLAAMLPLAGCTLKDTVRRFLHDEASSTIAVQIGESSYSKADLERYFDIRLSEFRDPADADRVKSNLLDSFIEDRLLLHQAEAMKVVPNPELLNRMLQQITSSGAERAGETGDPNREAALKRDLTESLKMQQYLHDHLLGNIKITEEECENYYKTHMSDFVRNDMVHLREILVDSQAQAEKVRATLAARHNKNFAEQASIYSKAASASDGGDLGTFQRGELPEQIEKVVFALVPGTLSKVVRTQYGYHIFLVEEKIMAHQQRLQEVKEQIRDRLLREQERRAIDKELAALRDRIQVKINQDKLDFRYVGTRFPAQ
jgi:parvulin-like peptidyl-prolyl isomerase